jgi:hypothetical protein
MGPQFETILQYYKQYYQQMFVLPEVTDENFLDTPEEEPLGN